MLLSFLCLIGLASFCPIDDSLVLGEAPRIFTVEQGGSATSTFSPNSIIFSGISSTSPLTASSSPTIGSLSATSSDETSYFAGNVVFESDLTVSGNATTSGVHSINILTVEDDTATSTIDGNLQVKNNLQVDGSIFGLVTLVSSGDVSVGGLFSVTGLSNLNGFISSASSTVSAPFHVSDILTSSSSIAVDGTSLFALTGGSVGIASSTPWAQLSVEKLTTGAPTFVVSDNGSSTPWFVVNEDGNVGIGTTSPSAKLEIRDSSSAGSLRVLSGGATSLSIMGVGRTVLDGSLAVAGVTDNFLTGTAQGDVILASNAGKLHLGEGLNPGVASGAIALTIDTNSNVGIGTTSPMSKLAVDGGLTIDLTADAGYSPEVTEGTFRVGTCTISNANTSRSAYPGGTEISCIGTIPDPAFILSIRAVNGMADGCSISEVRRFDWINTTETPRITLLASGFSAPNCSDVGDVTFEFLYFK